MGETVTWSGKITALSSIHHAGETRGTVTLLRREKVVLPDGQVVDVPVISGNTFRGRLRRIGEELLREVLRYEGQIAPAAAHALRGGGSLAKTGREPLSGARLAQLRRLIPQIGVFGAAAGGAIIDGALTVHKVIPIVRETQHITGIPSAKTITQLTQLETYTRQDDGDTRDLSWIGDSQVGREWVSSPQMLFRLETFPAGTVFHTGVQLRRGTPVEIGFFQEVWAEFVLRGCLGGRIGLGHGRIEVDLKSDRDLRLDECDWRAEIADVRDAAVDALKELT